MSAPREVLIEHPKPEAKVSVILLDWTVRESFHSLHYLNRQTVDRSQYELIWIEFYGRKPQAFMEMVQAAEEAGRPIVDKLVVMNYPRDFIFHKHRMYNYGVVLSEGEICVICDSDAMFTPTFIETVIAAFEEQPRSVIHLDEVRSVSRDFYPFNNPTFDEFLASECPNWTGRTTKGLAHSKDILHEANYGACMAARRKDIIQVGGSDEHLDYLGYICGPYDLTFRLVNAGCTERWLEDEFLYHTWHPGESGINIDYHGPSDGRGMATRALECRLSGKIMPGRENRAIRALRKNPACSRAEALARLESPTDEEWRASARLGPDDLAPRLVRKRYCGSFDVYAYRDCWYGIATSNNPFDPVRAKAGLYKSCLRAESRAEIERLIRRTKLYDMVPEVVRGGFRRARQIVRGAFALVGHSFNHPFDPRGSSPQLVRSDFRGYNIIHFQGTFFAVCQSLGSFDALAAQADPLKQGVRAKSIGAAKREIRRRTREPIRFEVRRQLYNTVWRIVAASRRWRATWFNRPARNEKQAHRDNALQTSLSAAICVVPDPVRKPVPVRDSRASQNGTVTNRQESTIGIGDRSCGAAGAGSRESNARFEVGPSSGRR